MMVSCVQVCVGRGGEGRGEEGRGGEGREGGRVVTDNPSTTFVGVGVDLLVHLVA